jgi:hypothetical protein
MPGKPQNQDEPQHLENPQGKNKGQDQMENPGNENREHRGHKHNEERHTGNKGNEDVAED